MTVYVTFECNGCDAVSERVRLGRRFESITGRSYGFGHYVYDKQEDAAPEGWVAYDLAGCTYCPECWAEIERELDAVINKAEGR